MDGRADSPAAAVPSRLGRLTIALSQPFARRGIYLGRRSGKAHVAIYRASGGRLGSHVPGFPGARISLVHHVGARTGRRRVSPLIYLEDGEAIAVVASKAGQPTNPAWFHNLRAHPETEVELGRERRPVRARPADPAERERLWPRFDAAYPEYAQYRERAAPREIPILILETATRARGEGEPMATRQIADLPGPGRLPLIGNAHQLKPDRLHLSAEAWAERYGPLYRFDLGGRQVVVISDVEIVNEALRDRPDGFRRWREILEITEELGPVGVFSAEGDDWRRMRRLVVTALNSNHLQRYFEVVSTCTGRLHRRLQRAAEEGRPFEIGTALSAFTVDVTSALAFGHDLNTLERGDDGLQEHLHRVFHMTNRRIFLPVRYWRYFKLPADRALDRSMVEIEKAVMTFIEETRERVAAHPELREEPRNFLESMVAAEEGTFSDADIVGNVFTLLLAGEDTTSHSMAWTIWSLAQRPEIQARWAEEADLVLGERPYATEYETIDDLRYGEAVLRESMRLTPVVPITGLEPLVDAEVGGVHVPAGTRLLLLHRRAGLRDVERAADFDPGRWLEEDGLEPPDQKTFLTFGAGPRFCPGRNLAFLEAKTALSMIARNFEIELDPTAGPVTEMLGFTMSPRGLRVRLRERAPALAA